MQAAACDPCGPLAAAPGSPSTVGGAAALVAAACGPGAGLAALARRAGLPGSARGGQETGRAFFEWSWNGLGFPVAGILERDVEQCNLSDRSLDLLE